MGHNALRVDPTSERFEQLDRADRTSLIAQSGNDPSQDTRPDAVAVHPVLPSIERIAKIAGMVGGTVEVLPSVEYSTGRVELAAVVDDIASGTLRLAGDALPGPTSNEAAIRCASKFADRP